LAELEADWFGAIEKLKNLKTVSSEVFVNEQLNQGKKVLAEGAQGTLLDIDFGTYPFVTSSNTITAGTCTGLGVAPNKVGNVLGIFKAYCTRVGSGPFPTELLEETGEAMRQEGREFGSTTGRPRRCGWIDLVALKYAIMINGVTHLAIMKADVLSIFESIKACTHYKIDGKLVDTMPYDLCDVEIEPVYDELKGWNTDLTKLTDLSQAPKELMDYLDYLEDKLGVPIHIVSVGPDRAQTLFHHGTF
jgi:adenylosuccinate synthase